MPDRPAPTMSTSRCSGVMYCTVPTTPMNGPGTFRPMADTATLEPLQEEPEGPPASPSGPLESAADGWELPPTPPLSALAQSARFGVRPLAFTFRSHRALGDVFRIRLVARDDSLAVTSHPDHVKALFTAKPDDAPSLTGESPLRPIVGPNSVLTSVGERHMRQRKLLLPPFHGDAVKRYADIIADVAEREVARWRPNEPFALAPRMQAI